MSPVVDTYRENPAKRPRCLFSKNILLKGYNYFNAAMHIVFLVIIFQEEKHVQTITVSFFTIVRCNLTLNASDITFLHAIVIAF